jgi:hypothetical protein
VLEQQNSLTEGYTFFLWWKNGDERSLSVPVPTLTLYTDASNLGWGAYLEESWALGLLSLLQQKEHINLLQIQMRPTPKKTDGIENYL